MILPFLVVDVMGTRYCSCSATVLDVTCTRREEDKVRAKGMCEAQILSGGAAEMHKLAKLRSNISMVT